MEVKVEIISKETIKPSSPTPHHLRTYKLSFRDQNNPYMYIPGAFFYTPNTIHGTFSSSSSPGSGGDDGAYHKRDDEYKEMVRKISQRLKVSLSETLTHFYPLAGRMRDNNFSVDCNDDGVEFSEARVTNCRLFDVLERPNFEGMIQLAPAEPTDYYRSPLLLVQANFFPCGGVAMSVKMSHKIADGFAYAVFIKGWSEIALGSTPQTVVPDFSTASSRFPPREDSPAPVGSSIFKETSQKVVKKRFMVDASKIVDLKTKVASARVQRPTRVEAVTALVWKCVVAASRSRFGGSRKSYVLVGASNLRSKLVPPLPKYCFGNVIGMFWLMHDNDDDDYENQATDLPGLVYLLRKEFEESINENKMGMKAARAKQLKGDDMEIYTHSSWCRFPVYDADFGWGNPIWVVSVGEDSIVPGIGLMDTRDGGVEILLSLNEEDMALVEASQELLAFASPNLSA